ncbi:methyl-accepting chemotaxis protein [Paenibacillus hunanensis]|uniref:methyl-accepting chemotaxis protein n=1 Tax=Paenibacillus hunanensis TaxID=539262 RepID=UPI002A6AE575|nr:methyl-accepting chemotaxis protein [Paenibacillus hunanensis]WPP40498.1 methyl-accepting chemotaxis protein [Paenibacillus hunanensis]
MYEKNKVMNWLCLVTVALSFLVFGLHQFTTIIPMPMTMNMTEPMNHMATSSLNTLRYILLVLPLALLAISLLLFSRNRVSAALPVMNTLILTLSSIALIAVGDGLVEYHFSVFMVVAFVAFYDSLALVLLTTAIFAIHHVAGFFLFPELLCGQHAYSFSLLLIHAVFLLLTSAAVSLLIVAKQRHTRALQKQKEQADIWNRTALGNLTQSGQYMDESASTLQRSSSALVHLSENIASSMLSIRTNATDELLPSQQRSEQRLQAITAAIHEVASSLEQLHEASDTTIRRAQLGNESLGEITAHMSALQQDVSQMARGIHEVDDKASQISSFIDIIAHLAAETNLLALNASIEAARAGQHGQSFAVVAQQVKKLSVETTGALARMSSIMQEFNGATTSALASSEHGTQRVQRTLTEIEHIQQAFQEIVIATELNGEQTERITQRMLELNEHAIHVNEATHYVTQMIEQSLDQHAAVDHILHQQLEHSSAVYQQAERLNSMSEELRTLVEQFSQRQQEQGQLMEHGNATEDSSSTELAEIISLPPQGVAS